MEWKRAKGKEVPATTAQVDSAARDLLSSRCPDIADELFEARREVVTEEDTGNVRLQIRFDRRVNGIPVVGDFVSIDLDPQDGEVLFFKDQTLSSLPALSSDVPVTPAQAAGTAETEAERLLNKQRVSFRPGSLRFGAPELVFTSTMSLVDTHRFLAYRVLTVFTRPSGEESFCHLLVDARTGKAVLVPPPP